VVDAGDLGELGTYLFMSPGADTSDPSKPPGVRAVLVDKVVIYDLRANRPGVSASLARTFIYAAIDVFGRSVSDPKQLQMYYAYANEFLPKAAEFAPERLSDLNAVIQSHTPDVPASLTQTSAFSNLNSPRSGDLSAEEI